MKPYALTAPVRPVPRARSRRGMTMIEVVLASALLAMLAAALIATVVFAQRSDAVRVKRLAAYDAANRLLLQYVDERRNKRMPPVGQPVDHEGFRFRYDLFEEVSTIEMLEERELPPRMAEGIKLLRVRVYDTSEPVPGDVQRGELLAELVRPNHLLVALYRNRDARTRNLLNPDFLADLGQMQPGTSGPTGGGR